MKNSDCIDSPYILRSTIVFVLTIGAFLSLGLSSWLALWACVAVIVLVVGTLFREVILRGFGLLIAGAVYRVDKIGIAQIPTSGGVLLLPNHMSYVDAVLLQLACPRPIRFMVFRDIYNIPSLNWIFRTVKAIPIAPSRAKESIRAASEQLKAGEVVCVFPEGELSRTGMLLRLKKGFEIIARDAGCPVVPVWLDQLWGSIFSFRGGKFFFKWPERIPYPVTVAFGEPIAAEEATEARVRQHLMRLGQICFERRPQLQGHLGRECVGGLRRHQNRELVVDGLTGSSRTGGEILAGAMALASILKKKTNAARIAVVLPPGAAAVVANLGVMLAGKIPVNLNFTAGREALEAAIRNGLIGHAITATQMEKKLENFPWPEEVLRLDQMQDELKKGAVKARILVYILPAWALCALMELPKTGGHDEGVLLFTSGSSGEPKGVVLSHRNILANVSQFGLMLNLRKHDTILASLPFFHSFGCTVTLWFPLIEGVRIVCYPNPLEVTKNADLIHKHKVTVLLATPTFLRGYLRKVEPEKLASLDLVVTGAEKLPRDVTDAFESRFGKRVMEGYGLTETAPVVSVNLPDPLPSREGDTVQPSNRVGSVGKVAPGIAVEIRNPDTGEILPLHETGMLWVAGPNIFEGYLNAPEKSAEVLKDGWFKTGDLARMDEDGFLFIEGRLSRFSKIAGEMVPHETIENRINNWLAGEDGDKCAVVMGIPDEAKGEALVLLCTQDVDNQKLREYLAAEGFPNLWVPKTIRKIETIPVLGSGKLDLKTCKDLALAP